MKKRLLITSIVMMLVVAVALSTATYAWFTSNASVTSSAVTLTAASNNAASLGIGWTATGSFGPSINPTQPADDPSTETVDESKFAPALPSALSTSNTITFIDKDSELNPNEISFKTEFATPNSSGDMVFLGAGTVTNPYRWNDGEDGHTSFFIKNLSPASTISTVTLTATIEGAGAALLRVGVFKWNSTNSKYELLGVIANTTDATYTAVESGTTLSGTYYKKYLGKYVEAIGGTSDQVTAGSADYVTDSTAGASNGLYIRSVETTNHAEVAYGTIGSGSSVNSIATTYCVESIVVAQSLGALQTQEFVILVWEDAVALGDNEQGAVASVALTFTAGAAAVPAQQAGD